MKKKKEPPFIIDTGWPDGEKEKKFLEALSAIIKTLRKLKKKKKNLFVPFWD